MKLRLRLKQTNENFNYQANAMGIETEPPAILPFTQTKLRTFVSVKDVWSFVWSNWFRSTIPQKIILSLIDCNFTRRTKIEHFYISDWILLVVLGGYLDDLSILLCKHFSLDCICWWPTLARASMLSADQAPDLQLGIVGYSAGDR